MPWANNPTIDELRRKYNIAIEVHQAAAKALTAARAGGTSPVALVEAEVKAADGLRLARDELLAAVTAAITGQVEAELRPPPPVEADAARTP